MQPKKSHAPITEAQEDLQDVSKFFKPHSA